MTWLDPGPFLRGVAWLNGDRPVRADPADWGRLSWNVGERASLPIGVRLEFTARGARAVEIRYRAPVTDGREPLPDCFALWRRGGGRRGRPRGAEWGFIAETLTEPAAERTVTVPLPAAEGAGRDFILYPPESRAPVMLGLRAVGGSIAPAPAQPRWLVHGDSITEGWWATRPARSWPAAAGRRLGLDTVNLGYAGSAHGEMAIAEQLASLPADAITLAFGTNCWHGVPLSAPLLHETVRAFLGVVRQGHPHTPLLVVSPVLRPAAEQAPNRLGASLGELRAALESAVTDLMRTDGRLRLLPGHGVLVPGQLADGLHPNDAGHAALAEAVAEALGPPAGLIPRRAAPRAAVW
ncbi:GDSL-type esterase/lipase family protein [Streptomyces sp. CAU 1734]|uniref:GDSL-type esterase/lipase family protein n=1 Tax=Streptomyces sp. CAU 1734 TaxID=3140360 RepID=UPI003260CF14